MEARAETVRLWGVGSSEKAGEAGAMGSGRPWRYPRLVTAGGCSPSEAGSSGTPLGAGEGRGAVWGWVWDRDGVPGEECRVWAAGESGVLPAEQRSSSKGRGMRRREGGSGLVGLVSTGGWCLAAHS